MVTIEEITKQQKKSREICYANELKINGWIVISPEQQAEEKETPKEKQIQKLISELKTRWMSNKQMQEYLKSSSGDRRGREIRENPPKGYVMVDRVKDCPTYCKEFTLVKEGSRDYENGVRTIN